ncbi:type II CAAX prenyl endopeptidase Rce1 family protein [Haloferax sp. DFSO52]|uniref:CPBP family glutamic-type intramembrane protease n=1 Tax=Haloferax sp. DFSO52 TaxID=3388505 RepID=UPI003A863A2F
MADWATFTGFTGLVLVVLLSFAYFSRGIPHGDGVSSLPSDDTDARVATDDEADRFGGDAAEFDGDDTASTTVVSASADDHERDRPTPTPVVPRAHSSSSPADMPTYLLIANVAVSQGLLGGFLAMGAWYAGIPASALGISVGNVPMELALGTVLGVALYGFNRIGSSLSRHLGFAPDEALRESLTPETTMGWVLLLVVALPLIAGFEELLFRGALIGALSVGFDVSPWLLAAVSSVAFGAGHTAQGRLGIVVTGLLGFVLAATFVLTGSLLVVFVAHYLVNALEFVGNELFGW